MFSISQLCGRDIHAEETPLPPPRSTNSSPQNTSAPSPLVPDYRDQLDLLLSASRAYHQSESVDYSPQQQPHFGSRQPTHAPSILQPIAYYDNPGYHPSQAYITPANSPLPYAPQSLQLSAVVVADRRRTISPPYLPIGSTPSVISPPPPLIANGSPANAADYTFECLKCSKRFAREEHLARHKLSHSDDKPHACRVRICVILTCSCVLITLSLLESLIGSGT